MSAKCATLIMGAGPASCHRVADVSLSKHVKALRGPVRPERLWKSLPLHPHAVNTIPSRLLSRSQNRDESHRRQTRRAGPVCS